jgi:hypothetical protein
VGVAHGADDGETIISVGQVQVLEESASMLSAAVR